MFLVVLSKCIETERHYSSLFLDVQAKKASAKEEVTEQMLDELIDVHLSETDTFSLLELPPRSVSTEAENAQAVT